MITIVGVGALGSHAALFLRNHRLRLIDGDRVESKNVLGQYHTVQAVRRNKAQACGISLGPMFGAKVETFPRVLEPTNVDILLRGATVVVDCCDNIVARQVIERYCGDKVPCVHGCLSADGTFGRVVWNPVFVPDAETPGQATCEAGENLPFHGLVGSVVAQEVQRYLTEGSQWSYEITTRPLGIRRIA